MNKASGNTLNIGWASVDLTPERPVIIAGQFHARVSEGVKDPVTSTVLVLESVADNKPGEHAVLISCDCAMIPNDLRAAVRSRVKESIPEINPENISINATHAHSGPELRTQTDSVRGEVSYGLSPEELGVIPVKDYVAGVVEKISSAVVEAWKKRAPGGMGFGLGQAVVGRNRRVSFYDGETKMYANTNDPEFSHIEGGEDPALNLLCTYDTDKKLTGMIVNLACPSQVSENIYQISADFWHDTRVALRSRLGENLYIMPQSSAAGDQSPHILFNRPAEARMLYLKGFTETMPENLDSNLGAPDALRREIAARISDGILSILPAVEKDINFHPVLAHRNVSVELPINKLTQADADAARADAEKLLAEFNRLRKDFKEHPEKKQEPLWYKGATFAYRKMLWFRGVCDRFEKQAENPNAIIEVHVLRLGDVVFATNPFEYYLDYGVQIKARSPAVQTFVVQLAGSGTYVPSARAVAGKGYGAIPASNPVGAEGGRLLAEKTLEIINDLWK